MRGCSRAWCLGRAQLLRFSSTVSNAKPEPPRPKVIFSGIQPTGVPHLGNYLGALQQWRRMQDAAEPDTKLLFCVVDLHAITVAHPPGLLTRWKREMLAALLAVGLDPARSTIFHQSTVPAHSELQWILSCTASTGYLSRMTQWKSKLSLSSPEEESSSSHPALKHGLFSYPILQAADILVHRATHVPVGEDQRQHLELTRDVAQRFNHRYKKTFRLPEPYILKSTAKITDLQEPTAKMSKSASSPAGIIELLDDPKVSAKKIRSAVTDSGSDVRFDVDEKPGISNLLTIYSSLTGRSIVDLEEEYAGRGYGDFKKDLADVVVEFVTPFRDRTLELLDDQTQLSAVLEQGRQQAAEVAEATLRDVWQRVGFVAPAHPGLKGQ